MDLTRPIAELMDRQTLISMQADIKDPLLLADYWPLRTVHTRTGAPGPMPYGILLTITTNQFLRSAVKAVEAKPVEAQAIAPKPAETKKPPAPKREPAKAS